jgi:hypothetical protein
MRLKISRKALAACGAALAVFLLAAVAVSCGDPFSSVRITGSPSLYAPLGERSMAMSDYFTVQTITSSLASSGAAVYDFIDPAEPNIVKVLLHYPLFTASLDIARYLTDIDLTAGMEQTIAPVSLTVPALGASSSTSIPISINGPIISSVNAGLATPPQTVVESGLPAPATLDYEIPLTVTGFTSATFSAGTLTFTFNLSGQSFGLVLILDSIAIETTTGTVIVQATPNIDVTQPNASISMSLAGITLPQDFDLAFTLSTQGGVLGHVDNLTITPTLSADTAVQAATGVNFTQNISVPAMTLPLGTDETFRSALIGAGSMTLDIGALPAGWTGITNTFDLLVTQGATTIANLSGVAEPIIVDLAGLTIATGDISAAATVHVSAVDASVSDVPPAGISLSCDIDTVITDIDSLVIHPAEPPVSDMTFSQAMDPTLAEWVDSIVLSDFGLDVTVNNQLPAGCNLSLDVVSPTFSINSLGNAFPVGVSTTRNIRSAPLPITLNPATIPTIQFDVGMNLSGYDEGTGNLTIANVTPGQGYTFGGTITPIITWTSVQVNPALTGYSGTFPEAGTMDLSSMTSFLGSGINFDDIPVHLYLSGPDGLSINASVQANYGGASSYLLGSASGGASLAMVQALPNPLSATVGTYNAAIPASSASLTSLADIINARPTDLTLDYNVQSDSRTFTPAMLGSAFDIRLDLIMVLPFEWTVVEPGAPIAFDGLPDGTGDDLFGRTSTVGGLNDVLDLLESMTIGVNINNQTGLNLAATLTAAGGFSKTLDAGTGARSIVLDAADVTLIRETVPFRPVLSIMVPPGTYAFRRDAALSASLSVTAVADIDQTFELGGGSN